MDNDKMHHYYFFQNSWDILDDTNRRCHHPVKPCKGEISWRWPSPIESRGASAIGANQLIQSCTKRGIFGIFLVDS